MHKPRLLPALLLLLALTLASAVSAQGLPTSARFDKPVTLQTGVKGMPLRTALELLSKSVGLTPVLEQIPDVTVQYNIPNPRPFRQVWGLITGLQQLDFVLLNGNLMVVAPPKVLANLKEPRAGGQNQAPIKDVFYDLPGDATALTGIIQNRYQDAHVAVLKDAKSLLVSAPANEQASIQTLMAQYQSRAKSVTDAQKQAQAAANQAKASSASDSAAAKEPIVLAYYRAAIDQKAMVSFIQDQAPSAKVTLLPDSGIIAVNAPASLQHKIADAVQRLQGLQQSTQPTTERDFFQLSYADPAKVADAIRASLGGGDAMKNAVALDDSTRTIIVTGTPDMLDAASQVVHNLDKQPQQINVQVRVQEVSTNAANSMGINLASDVGLLAMNLADQGLNFVLNPTKGLTSFNLNATLNALDQQGMSRDIQDSHLSLTSGKQGSFNAGGEVKLVLTNSDGSTSVTPIDYGTQIKVTPVLTHDGHISMQIQAEVSGFKGELTKLSGLQLTTRKLNTQVVALPGQAYVIGGLLHNTVSVSRNGVPLLSQIPILGSLFQSTSTKDESVDIMVVVKADLVHDGQPAKVLAVTPSSDTTSTPAATASPAATGAPDAAAGGASTQQNGTGSTAP